MVRTGETTMVCRSEKNQIIFFGCVEGIISLVNFQRQRLDFPPHSPVLEPSDLEKFGATMKKAVTEKKRKQCNIKYTVFFQLN